MIEPEDYTFHGLATDAQGRVHIHNAETGQTCHYLNREEAYIAIINNLSRTILELQYNKNKCTSTA